MSNEQGSSPFNPELLMGLTVNDANSTEIIQIPEGEYIGVIGGIGADNFRSYDIRKGPNAGSKGYSLDMKVALNDEGGQLKEHLGREPEVRYSIMMDVTKDGTIDMGKGRNVGLGRLREAVGQNGTGRPWSFGMLGGQVVKVKVKHRIDNNVTPARTYAEVADVTKAS